MNWIYRNNNDNSLLYDSHLILPGEEIETLHPAPVSLGLTCIQEGNSPDPVLFHDDLYIQPGQEISVSLNDPLFSHNVALEIRCMSIDGGALCRFNSTSNKPIPIDSRGLKQVMRWNLCSRIFFTNTSEDDIYISVTALEVLS